MEKRKYVGPLLLVEQCGGGYQVRWEMMILCFFSNSERISHCLITLESSEVQNFHNYSLASQISDHCSSGTKILATYNKSTLTKTKISLSFVLG